MLVTRAFILSLNLLDTKPFKSNSNHDHMTQIYLLQTYRIFTTGLNHLSNEANFVVTLDTYFQVTMYICFNQNFLLKLTLPKFYSNV